MNGRRRVLIVDDEPDLVRMLAMPFEAAGDFQVETAFDGAAALEKAKAFRPEVVLLDLIMPGVDGWEVYRRLKAAPETRATTIIIMTAAAAKSVEDRAKDEGIPWVVLKPLDVKQLISAIREDQKLKAAR